MTITILDPTGTVDAPGVALAERPTSLEGLRIAVLDNRKTNAGLLLETIADRLGERYGARRSITKGKPSAGQPAPEDAILEITHEADLVLTGSGD